MMALWLAAWVWAQEVPVLTSDGGRAVLHRTARQGAPPVLLLHGISSNHRFWDVSDDRSLAVWLHEAGYDVWNLDLRGHGSAMRDANGRRQRPTWTVDTYGVHDLPESLSHIQAETGFDRVHFVGHSMGGMVLAIALANEPELPLASAVVVASPLEFRDPDPMTRLLLNGSVVVRPLPFLPTPLGAKGMALMGRDMPLQTDAVLHNPENYSRDAEARMFRTVVSPLSRGEVRQFSLARKDGEFRSADGQVAYRHALGSVTVPMLFLAGRADRVVSPDRVWTYYDSVGSSDKAFVVISKANGYSGDYGHLDFGCADRAVEDVYGWIGYWLDAHPVAAP